MAGEKVPKKADLLDGCSAASMEVYLVERKVGSKVA